jgi:hypothetical protein
MEAQHAMTSLMAGSCDVAVLHSRLSIRHAMFIA